MPEFAVFHVPSGSAMRIEQLGTKPKFQFDDPVLGRCYCKIVTRELTGEDWTEKVAAEVAERLGLPHALYELGVFEGRRCVVSPVFSEILIHGNELLAATDAFYQTQRVEYRQSGHTLEAIWTALDRYACTPPLKWTAPAGIITAGEVFTGYLLLDALIGNTDRHDENWGVVETKAGSRHLAPTYDHAASLGFQLRDSEKHDRMQSKDRGYKVEAYAKRAKSALFSERTASQPMSTLEAFQRAVERWPTAASVWIRSLQELTQRDMEDILSGVPGERASGISREFALRMLVHNRSRLVSLL
ncbi:MAG: HipA domain-containing protein [Bryobacterales bacterium]|nr:HipA domain-containing protein [Bryobacterales bacterium]